MKENREKCFLGILSFKEIELRGVNALWIIFIMDVPKVLWERMDIIKITM
jgi:hypothetical protein